MICWPKDAAHGNAGGWGANCRPCLFPRRSRSKNKINRCNSKCRCLCGKHPINTTLRHFELHPGKRPVLYPDANPYFTKLTSMKKILPLLLSLGLLSGAQAQKQLFVRVYGSSGGKIAKGHISDAGESALYLRRGKQADTTVSVSDIHKIRLYRHPFRLGALVAALPVGAGIGLVLDAQQGWNGALRHHLHHGRARPGRSCNRGKGHCPPQGPARGGLAGKMAKSKGRT